MRRSGCKASDLVAAAVGAGLILGVASGARADRPTAIVVGNVVVLPTDATMLTPDGKGGWGIVYNDEVSGNPPRLAQAFYAEGFGDDYDYLSFFTAFDDSSGINYYALAWSVRNTVAGVGLGAYNHGKDFGSPARLKTWVNMRKNASALADPNAFVWPVWAQEMGHLDLSHLKFDDGGFASSEMLGRDNAHWSALLQAEGSVMDGNQWRHNADGTFTKIAEMQRYSPLDQYALGLRDADEVPAFFVLRDATLGPQPLGPTSTVPVGGVVDATAHTITIDDVMTASGIRLPQAGDAQTAYRVATILLVAPGEDPESARKTAAFIDGFLPQLEGKFRRWTDGRGTLCTRLREDCPLADLTIAGLTVEDAGGDGVVDPGEEATVRATLSSSTGAGPVAVSVDADGLFRNGGTLMVPRVEPGAPVPVALRIQAGAQACGAPLHLALRATVDDRAIFARTEIPIGVAGFYQEGFEADADDGWQRAGDGPAAEGAWERGKPEQREARGLRVNPAAAAEGETVWATGLSGGAFAGDNDVDGREVLESPAVTVPEAASSVALSYRLWFNAATFDVATGFPMPAGDPFTVLASWDGGDFTEIDRVGRSRGLTNRWVTRFASVPGAGRALRLRFVAEDEYPDTLVEAALDDVRLWARTGSACPMPAPPPPEPDGGSDAGGDDAHHGGCGCRVGAPRPGADVRGGASLPAVFAAATITWVRSRRARRP